MARDRFGDDINPYDLHHVAEVMRGQRFPESKATARGGRKMTTPTREEFKRTLDMMMDAYEFSGRIAAISGHFADKEAAQGQRYGKQVLAAYDAQAARIAELETLVKELASEVEAFVKHEYGQVHPSQVSRYDMAVVIAARTALEHK